MRRLLTVPNGIAIIIGLLASIVVYWQTTRITPLIDYSYQVENAYRMYRGAMPFRDFFLVVAPGTYAVMASLMHLVGGYSHMVQVYYTMMVAFVTVLLTYRICVLMGVPSSISASLLIPLIFAGQSVYPYPLYDPNVALTVLGAFYVYLYIRKHRRGWQPGYVLAGMFAVLPILFKQNTGGVYAGTTIIVFLFAIVFGKSKQELQIFAAYIFGMLLIVAGGYIWLSAYGAFDQYIYQTFTFPSFAKNPIDAVHIILSQYRNYGEIVLKHWFFILVPLIGIGIGSKYFQKWTHGLVTLYIVVVCMYALFVTPPLVLHDTSVLLAWVSIVALSVFTSISVFVKRGVKDDLVTTQSPLILLASAHATFLSHGIVHSSYHMWPFAMVAVGHSIASLKRIGAGYRMLWTITRVLLIFLIIILARAVKDNYAMGYVDHAGEVSIVTHGKLKGLSTPGTWIREFETMMSYVDKTIPMDAVVAFLPGEDPFFSVSGRDNPLHFSLLHAGVYTLAASVIIPELLEKRVEWIVVKTTHQAHPWVWISNMDEISYWIGKYYTPDRTIGIYQIYKKIQ